MRTYCEERRQIIKIQETVAKRDWLRIAWCNTRTFVAWTAMAELQYLWFSKMAWCLVLQLTWDLWLTVQTF